MSNWGLSNTQIKVKTALSAITVLPANTLSLDFFGGKKISQINFSHVYYKNSCIPATQFTFWWLLRLMSFNTFWKGSEIRHGALGSNFSSRDFCFFESPRDFFFGFDFCPNLVPRAHVSFGQRWPTDTWALGTRLFLPPRDHPRHLRSGTPSSPLGNNH